MRGAEAIAHVTVRNSGEQLSRTVRAVITREGAQCRRVQQGNERGLS